MRLIVFFRKMRCTTSQFDSKSLYDLDSYICDKSSLSINVYRLNELLVCYMYSFPRRIRNSCVYSIHFMFRLPLSQLRWPAYRTWVLFKLHKESPISLSTKGEVLHEQEVGAEVDFQDCMSTWPHRGIHCSKEICVQGNTNSEKRAITRERSSRAESTTRN